MWLHKSKVHKVNKALKTELSAEWEVGTAKNRLQQQAAPDTPDKDGKRLDTAAAATALINRRAPPPASGEPDPEEKHRAGGNATPDTGVDPRGAGDVDKARGDAAVDGLQAADGTAGPDADPIVGGNQPASSAATNVEDSAADAGRFKEDDAILEEAAADSSQPDSTTAAAVGSGSNSASASSLVGTPEHSLGSEAGVEEDGRDEDGEEDGRGRSEVADQRRSSSGGSGPDEVTGSSPRGGDTGSDANSSRDAYIRDHQPLPPSPPTGD